MRIFLTGATGFVGSFVLRKLLSTGEHEISVLIRNPKKAWRIKDLLDKVEVVKGQLDKFSMIKSDLKDFFPEAIVHLAWEGVSGAERNDSSQWSNIIHTMKLVELANELNVKTFIGIGSQAEYGPCQNKIDESTATKPTTIYGASKLASQLLSERLCSQFEIRYAWLRLFSSFGPADNSEWLIPYLIRSLIAKERPKLTEGEQLWDYIFVEDVASAIATVLELKNATGVFNLGSGDVYKLRNIIEKIRDLIDSNLPLGFGEVDYRSDQVMHLQADISKLNKATGWLPKSDFNSAIKKTVDWYLRDTL